ncbi:hypothetical protein ACOME3_004481 [Neoechinorhynchus agilis]
MKDLFFRFHMAFYAGGLKDTMRAKALLKRRQEEHKMIEDKKKKIEEENRMRDIDNKFNASAVSVIESALRSDTVGLVSLEDLKKKQEELISRIENKRSDEKMETGSGIERKIHSIEVSRLSFASEFMDNEEECNKPGRYYGKNPDVDTSFLPDRERDLRESKLREELKREWLTRQKAIKMEMIEIYFSYWDGSGHPRTLQLNKGQTIQQFLFMALDMLRKENVFIELKAVSVDQLMFVKDDHILPHHLSFYDLIIMEARGRHGQLFFDDKAKRRVTNDAVIDDDDIHSGKVLIRGWYDRNKHIFPACRWEPFDVEKHHAVKSAEEPRCRRI